MGIDLNFKYYSDRKFRFRKSYFSGWIVFENESYRSINADGMVVFLDKPYSIKKWSFYTYKRFLVEWIACHQANATIPNSAKRLYQKFYKMFEKPFAGGDI